MLTIPVGDTDAGLLSLFQSQPDTVGGDTNVGLLFLTMQ